MSRHPRKPPHKTESLPAPAGGLHLKCGLIIAVILTLLLGGIPFGLGRYIELNSPAPFDSGAYVYSAQHLLNGARLGIEEISSAFPGTLIVNIIGVKLFGFSDVGPKVVQMILQTAALIFMFYTLRRIFGSAAAVTGTVVAAVYLSAPLIAKFGNVKEQFMIAFMMCAGSSFLLYEFSGKRFWLVLCGVFAIEPYYFKASGLSIVIAMAGYLLIDRGLCRIWKKLYIEFVLLLAGMGIGLLFPASLFIWQRQIGRILRSLPVLMIELAAVLLIIFALIFYAHYYSRKFQLRQRLNQIPSRFYKIGSTTLIVGLLAGILMVTAAGLYYSEHYQYPSGSLSGDIGDYITSLPFVSVPLQFCQWSSHKIHQIVSATGLRGGYVGDSRKLITLAELAPKILRYYKALSVPILLAAASVLTAGYTVFMRLKTKQPIALHHRWVWMLTAWWILDMVFVWVSPHSYEEYYLPLCASAAMLSGYTVWRWQQHLTAASFKMPWLFGGLTAMVILAGLSIPIFIGQRYSPDTGADYTANGGPRRRGFAESLDRIRANQKAPWETGGEYIRTHSAEQDTLYVWGWVPGIYVAAQRMAPVPSAFEANMHIMPPDKLSLLITQMVQRFEQTPPKFIVDTRKRHFPFNRPPLELWPILPQGMLGNDRPRPLNPDNPQEITAFDASYRRFLNDKVSPDEAQRYDAMKPVRDFVMQKYRFAGQYGEHMVFERKP
jgi:hypothetical protein